MNTRPLGNAIFMALLATSLAGCVYFDKKSTPSIHNLNVVLPKALAGDTNAQQQLGSSFNNQYSYGGIETDTMAGLRYLEEAAESDNASAESALGNLYNGNTNQTGVDGLRVQPDLGKALYWLHRAANHRMVDAYYGLAHIYGASNFAGADPIEVCKWILIARPQSLSCAPTALSPEQIEQARLRAAAWQAAHPAKKP